MEAAESIFEGKFDNVKDDADEDVEMNSEPKKKMRQVVGPLSVLS